VLHRGVAKAAGVEGVDVGARRAREGEAEEVGAAAAAVAADEAARVADVAAVDVEVRSASLLCVQGEHRQPPSDIRRDDRRRRTRCQDTVRRHGDG
jgi:hypothetical protein